MNERESAVALYTLLGEFAQLRTKTVRDVDAYEQVIWDSDIPLQQGCDCIAWHRDVDYASDKPSLEVRRPRLNAPPEPPELAQNWVRREQLNDSSLDIPLLYTALAGESAEAPHSAWRITRKCRPRGTRTSLSTGGRGLKRTVASKRGGARGRCHKPARAGHSGPTPRISLGGSGSRREDAVELSPPDGTRAR